MIQQRYLIMVRRNRFVGEEVAKILNKSLPLHIDLSPNSDIPEGVYINIQNGVVKCRGISTKAECTRLQHSLMNVKTIDAELLLSSFEGKV